jgi:hypothetical protein
MWSISSAEPYDFCAIPYSASTAYFLDCGTLRIALVWKLAEQMTGFVSFEEYAPGEQRRSGFAPSVQPEVFVRGLSSTV